MNVIAGFEKIEKREILDCRIKSLKEQLNHKGYGLSSFEILVLCEAITFRYGKLDYRGKDILGIPYVTSTNMGIHELIYNKLEIGFQMEKIPGDELGIEKFKHYIDNQIPVLVELDGSVFMSRKKEHWIDMHYISYVLVVGYDDEKREFGIVLTQSAQADKYITLGYDSFQCTRINNVFPYPSTGKCYYITSCNDLKNEKLETVLKDSLKNIAVKMLNGKTDDDITSDDVVIRDICIGLNGMKKFIRDYKLKSNALLKNKNIRTSYQLEFLIMRNNMLYGTLSCYRNEFVKALEMIYEKYNIIECKKAAELFEKSAKSWKKLIMTIGILSRNKEKISFVSIRILCSLMKKIYKKEKKAYSMLSKL